MFKNWSNRDWVWTVGILFFFSIVFASLWLIGIKDESIMNYFSFMATGVSVALALVAIGISISQNESSKTLNSEMHSILSVVDEKLNGVKDSLSSINNMEVFSKDSTNNHSEDKNQYNLTRIHGVINTSKPWNGKDFLKALEKNLKRINDNCEVVDYSIMPLEKSLDPTFEYSTNINLIFNERLDFDFLEAIIDEAFSNIEIQSKSSQTYFNNGI